MPNDFHHNGATHVTEARLDSAQRVIQTLRSTNARILRQLEDAHHYATRAHPDDGHLAKLTDPKRLT